MTGPLHVPCAAGIVHDGTGRLLLVRRGRPPAAGTWSIPGGTCRPGEPADDACVRELAEETGLAVEVVRHAGRVELPAPRGGVFVVDDFVCRVLGGRLAAGDDADDARFVTGSELAGLVTSPGLLDTLRQWSLLPR